MILLTLYVWHSWTPCCLFWELLCLQDRLWESYLNVDIWIKQTFILMEEILRDTLCHHSRTELCVNLACLSIQTNLITFFPSPEITKTLSIVLFFWYIKAWMKLKFCRCYQSIITLISVEFSCFSNWFQLMLMWRVLQEGLAIIVLKAFVRFQLRK